MRQFQSNNSSLLSNKNVYNNHSKRGISSEHFYIIKKNNSTREKRWIKLYNLNKVRQNRLNKQIEEKRKKDDEDLISECTFSPKINKNLSLNHSFSIMNNNNSKNENFFHSLNLFQRQNAWNTKKQNKINFLSNSLIEKSMKECIFSPEINKDDYLNKTKINYKTNKVLEDPESYNQYIKRLERKREMEKLKKKNQRMTPGSGYIWNNKPKKYDLKYDYTSHSNSKKILPRSKSSNNLIVKHKNNNINNTKYIDIDKNDYYEKVYLKNSFSTKFNCNQSKIDFNIKDNSENENNNLFDKPIEFNKAVKILHNELYSIQLLSNDY